MCKAVIFASQGCIVQGSQGCIVQGCILRVKMASCKELCDELSDKTDILLNLSTTGLIGFFGQKKNKLTWTGTLNDLKTFVSTIIDEKTAEGAAWRSPSGGKWCFSCEDLEITWHSKSGAIIFDGVRAGNLVKQIKHILLKLNDMERTTNSDLNWKRISIEVRRASLKTRYLVITVLVL